MKEVIVVAAAAPPSQYSPLARKAPHVPRYMFPSAEVWLFLEHYLKTMGHFTRPPAQQTTFLGLSDVLCSSFRGLSSN